MKTLTLHKCKLLLVCLSLTLFNFPSIANDDFCSISCIGQVNLTIGTSGFAVVTPSMMTSANSNCIGPLEVHIMNANGVNIGNVVDCSYAGQLLMVSVLDPASGIDCWGSLLVEDKSEPTLICNDISVTCNSIVTPAVTGFPIVNDNCGLAGTPTFTDEFIDYECADPNFMAVINRTWTVTDLNGNVATCVQQIFLEKPDLNQVMFPPAATVDCNNPNTDPSNTGEPTLGGEPIGDFCGIMFTSTDGAPFETCGGGYKFIREWLVVDWCTGDILTNDQLIEITDTTPPTITCPADLTVSTTSNACSGNIILPDPTVTDDCSNFTISIDFDFNQVGNVFTNVPVGTYPVTYTATDDCDNAASCTFNITVKDQIAPIAVCDTPTKVSIGSDGTAKVNALTFDDGSTDNCGIDTFLVSRMDDPDFGECVFFTCADVGDTVMVVLQVADECGNTNFCMVEAIVEDKLPPSIVCPPNKTVECTEIASLTPTLPGATDNCGIDTTFFVDDSTGLDLCTMTGIILREWFVIDLGGLRDSCIQIFTIEDNVPLTFTFPNDTTISCTDPTTIDFTGNASVTSGCRSIVINISDTRLPVDICNEKLFRKFRFYDNCADTFLMTEFTQTIIIKDLEVPVVTCPDTMEVNNRFLFPRTCDVYAFLEASATDSCSGIESLTNDSPFQQNTLGFSASGVYPLGETTVTFTAMDSCMNTATCETVVVVADSVAPLILCVPDLVLAVSPGNPGVLDINDFYPDQIQGEDLCDPAPPTFHLVESTVTQFEYSCDDITGTAEVVDNITYFATDVFGNRSGLCATNLIVTCPRELAVAGIIYNEREEKVDDVMIKVKDHSDSSMTYTSNGFYLNDSLTLGNDYTITPEKNNDWLNGVTTYDLVLISKHIIGTQPLDSPYKIIAADANRSGNVTTLDIIHLRKLILHLVDELPQNTSWRFVDQHFQFADATQPLAENFPESMTCLNLTETQVTMNFVGVKIGDVNQTAVPNNLITVDSREKEKPFELFAEDFILEKNQTYELPIFAKEVNEFSGFQFTLNFNPSEIEFLDMGESILKKENFGLRFLENGQITCSWARASEEELKGDKPLFYLRFKTKNAMISENPFWINSQITPAEGYNIKNKIHGINLQFQKNAVNLISNSDEAQLFQNQPNPFSTSTEIQFYLPQVTRLELQILDISGKIIHTYHQQYPAGLHQVEVDGSIFPSSGVYVYKLISPTFSASKKMIVL